MEWEILKVEALQQWWREIFKSLASLEKKTRIYSSTQNMAVGQLSVYERYYRTKWAGTTERQKIAVNRDIDQATRAPGTTGDSTGTTGKRGIGTTRNFSVLPLKNYPESSSILAFAGTWLGTKSGTTERARYYRAISSGTTGARKMCQTHISGNGMAVVCIFGLCKICKQD